MSITKTIEIEAIAKDAIEKIEALKLKDKIKKNYIEAYPVPTIIPITELHN